MTSVLFVRRFLTNSDRNQAQLKHLVEIMLRKSFAVPC